MTFTLVKASQERIRVSSKIGHFTESAIREMSAIADESGAVNLAQGSPDFASPKSVKGAACAAIQRDHNQYEVNAGSLELRRAIASKARSFNGIEADAEDNVTVTCGTTEAITAAMVALIDTGDKVIIPEPLYESYVPATLISGARVVHLPMSDPVYTFEEEKLKAAFSQRPKVILLNTPNNPTGRVLSISELRAVADLCEDYNVVAIADEIYERITYGENHHVSLASIGEMSRRTVTVSGMSKTFSVTGWRVGYAIADKPLTRALRTIHDFLTVCAPSPFQEAATTALALPDSYYAQLARGYDRKRRFVSKSLRELGFLFEEPEGAYYLFADFSALYKGDDYSFAKWLVKGGGVALVPGSSFYSNRSGGKSRVRLAFCKKESTLRDAVERMRARIA